MADSISDLLKEVRLAAEFLTSLPERLVNEVMGARLSYRDWKERVQAAKKSAELCEIGKKLATLYFTKGSVLGWLRSPKFTGSDEDLWLKGEFASAAEGLEELRTMLQEVEFADLKLVVEAGAQITNAARAYRVFASLANDQLRDRETLIAICTTMEAMLDAGVRLIDECKEGQKLIDYSF